VRAADPFDLFFLNRSEQLRLQVVSQITDLVEEEGSTGGQLELPELLTDGAGKGSFFVSEQGALDELFRNGGQVDGDKGAVAC
jgi:hypothetical protein